MTPPIRLSCPRCHRQFTVSSELQGKKARCLCGNVLPIHHPSNGGNAREDLLAEVTRALREHDYEQCATLCKRGLAQSPRDYHLTVHLAFALQKLGHYNEALPRYRELREMKPSCTEWAAWEQHVRQRCEPPARTHYVDGDNKVQHSTWCLICGMLIVLATLLPWKITSRANGSDEFFWHGLSNYYVVYGYRGLVIGSGAKTDKQTENFPHLRIEPVLETGPFEFPVIPNHVVVRPAGLVTLTLGIAVMLCTYLRRYLWIMILGGVVGVYATALLLQMLHALPEVSEGNRVTFTPGPGVVLMIVAGATAAIVAWLMMKTSRRHGCAGTS